MSHLNGVADSKVGNGNGNGEYSCRLRKIIVLSLGVCVVLSLVNITLLQLFGRDIPAALSAISSTALGALTGSLASQVGAK